MLSLELIAFLLRVIRFGDSFFCLRDREARETPLDEIAENREQC